MARIFTEHELLDFLGSAAGAPRADAAFRGLRFTVAADGVRRVVNVDGFVGELSYNADLSSRIRVAQDIIWLANLPATIAVAACRAER